MFGFGVDVHSEFDLLLYCYYFVCLMVCGLLLWVGVFKVC